MSEIAGTYMRRRRRNAREKINDATSRKGGIARDPRIVSIPLEKNGNRGQVVGRLKLRFLPNKPSGSTKTDDVDAYSDSNTPWCVVRYQHNFEINGNRVIFDCPTSLPFSDIKDLDDDIVNAIRDSNLSDKDLATELGMDAFMINRVRHNGKCPICIDNTAMWKDGKQEEVRARKSSRRPHYFAWAIVLEVNGSDNHEWCDGSPRIIHFTKTVWELLQSVLKKSEDEDYGEDEKFIFFEMTDSLDENDERIPCEGRDFLIQAVMGTEWPTYTDVRKPSKFLGDPYQIATDDKSYSSIVEKIEPLEDIILRNHTFNPYEQIESWFLDALGVKQQRRADIDIGNDNEDNEDNSNLRKEAEKLLDKEEKPVTRRRSVTSNKKENDPFGDDFFDDNED
jgi:hypothetical protein